MPSLYHNARAFFYRRVGVGFPPGHFYSPIVNKRELRKRTDEVFTNPPRQLPHIDLREDEQLQLLEQFRLLYPSTPFTEEAHPERRYHYRAKDNVYSYSDAIMLHCMMRVFQPKRIVEVGSGFSSTVMLDTNDLFFSSSIHFTFIEPHPEIRFYRLLRHGERQKLSILKSTVQAVDIQVFDQLEANDILFIDSTHVSKAGSDVNHALFSILPRLKAGVLIHFHDIFYPFEYRKDWVLNTAGFGWNESYLLRAFLMYNSDYEIVMFNTFLEHFHTDWFRENMPLCLKDTGGSIWLRKLK